MKYQEELDSAIMAAKRGGEIIRKYFKEDLKFIDKGAGNIASIADRESEKAILETLSKFDYSYFSEEIGYSEKITDTMWIIDPLDGTNNFSMKIPHVSISIALMKKDEIVLGLIYQPFSDTLIYAVKKEGVFLDGERFSITENVPFEKQIISLIFSYETGPGLQGEVFRRLSGKVKRIMSQWGGALEFLLLCSGKGHLLYSYRGEAEDQIAGLLIAQELGLVILDLEGNRFEQRGFQKSLEPFVIGRDSESVKKVLEILK